MNPYLGVNAASQLFVAELIAAEGPRKNNFPFWGIEAPGWQGARTKNAGSI